MYGDFDNLDFVENNYFITAFVENEQIGLPTQFNSVPNTLVYKTTADNFDKDSISEIQDISGIAIY
jgi:hypothetical protein